MADQRFHPAETFGKAEVLQSAGEVERTLHRAFELEGEHAAEAAHLSLCERVLWMGAQTGIVDASDVIAGL